jgi:hypothetical protein
MEKKRKRASFTIPPSPKDREPESEAVLHSPKQVVEVVSEQEEPDSYTEQRVPSAPHTQEPPVHNYSGIKTNLYDEEEAQEMRRTVREVPKIVVETPTVVVERPKVVEIHEDTESYEQASYQAERPAHRHIASSVTHDSPQEVTVVASAEPEEVHTPPVRVLNHEDTEDGAKEQKATVAELFGKGHESPMPEITVHHGKAPKGMLLWGITMLAIAIGVGGGLILFTTPKQPVSQTPSVTVNPTAQPTQSSVVVVATPTPTPALTPQITKKDLKVQVQNGGGVVGAGSKMKSLLEDKGYTVTDVRNADNYSYDVTTIKIKGSKMQSLTALKTDLGSDYTISTTDATLAESSAYDVVVIVGKK